MSVLRPKDPLANEAPGAEGQSSLPSALSVSEAMQLAKKALEGIRVCVMGEVTELSDKPGYKAVYFSLGDDGATMPALMWKNRYTASGVRLAQGMLVQATGYFSAYAQKGRMQFVVNSLAPAGEGDLRLKVANLAKKLEREGLMDPAAKRKLPKLPSRIGLVTSPSGKAVWDVVRTLKARYPLATLVFAGVNVEGATAAAQMIDALRTVASADVQVVLLVRGGGAYEDFMPFNDEGLARAIRSMPMPVVTGIGHEPDNTIADMVADRRCSNPTAAAQASATPAIAELGIMVEGLKTSLASSASRGLLTARERLRRLESRPVMRDAHAIIGGLEQRVDSNAARLATAIPNMLAYRQSHTAQAHARLLACANRIGVIQASQLKDRKERLALAATATTSRRLEGVLAMRARLAREGAAIAKDKRSQVASLALALDGLSPLGVLARGYAVMYAGDGKIAHSTADVQIGEGISVRLADGSVEASVTGISPLSQSSNTQ